MRRSFANQIIGLVGIFAIWVALALKQARNHSWLTSEGKISSNWVGGKKTNPFTRVMMMHMYWDRIQGTVVDVKLDRMGNETLYQPIISYRYYDRKYLDSPSCERLNIRKDAYYRFNKYPIGTTVMLLIPEGQPEEFHILEDTLKVEIKSVVLTGIFVVPYVVFKAYYLIFS